MHIDDAQTDRSASAALVAFEQLPVRRLAVADLCPGESPRLRSEERDYVEMLAEIDGPLPPIIVHGPTLRVIDGMHRLKAARLKGQMYLEARIFDGSTDDAFVEAVRANVRHGKPLSRQEREMAATRILASHPRWSDRAIAEVCGVSPSTVSNVRRCPNAHVQSSNVRVGRDGRLRPLDSSQGRRLAIELFSSNPHLSAREVARRANISPTTASDVRTKLLNGTDPLGTNKAASAASHPSPSRPPPMCPPPSLLASDSIWVDDDRRRQLQTLADDNALTSTDAGQRCIELLMNRFVSPRDWLEIAGELPRSRVYVIAELARHCARSWTEFADLLRDRAAGR